MKNKLLDRHKHKHNGTKGNKGKVTLKLIPGADPEDLQSLPLHASSFPKGVWRERKYSAKLPKRFLESRLGMQWDEVWSEICAEADARTETGYLFRQEFHWLVQKSLDDIDSDHRDFYVDRNGALRSRQHSWHHYRREVVSKIVRVGDKLYHEHAGIWYQVKMAPAKSSYRGSGVWALDQPELKDEFLGVLRRDWYALIHNEYGESRGEMNICVWKKSASKKEIKAVRKALEELS
jgi:hypothetical protein